MEFSYDRQTDRPLLKIPSFELLSGEKLFLFGPSGSGKTTLLELLAGVQTPKKGRIEILGQDLGKLSAKERDRFRGLNLGFIFQSFNLIPYLDVASNVLLPLRLHKDLQSKIGLVEAKSKMKKIFDRLGISNLETRNVLDLSVGQQQRVAVARAFIAGPGLILADEPTSALDYDSRRDFIELLFELSKINNTSLVFVSHDQSLKELFDRKSDLRDLWR